MQYINIEDRLKELLDFYLDPNCPMTLRDETVEEIHALMEAMKDLRRAEQYYYDPFLHKWVPIFIGNIINNPSMERSNSSWGGGFYPIPELEPEPPKCEHEWVNISLMAQKLVCKKCDVEHKEEIHGVPSL